MENLIEITSVPLIVAIVYGALTIYKKIVGEHEKLNKIIPIIAAQKNDLRYKKRLCRRSFYYVIRITT